MPHNLRNGLQVVLDPVLQLTQQSLLRHNVIADAHPDLPGVVGRVPGLALVEGEDQFAVEQFRQVTGNAGGADIPSNVILQFAALQPEQCKALGNGVAGVIADQKYRAAAGDA